MVNISYVNISYALYDVFLQTLFKLSRHVAFYVRMQYLAFI